MTPVLAALGLAVVLQSVPSFVFAATLKSAAPLSPHKKPPRPSVPAPAPPAARTPQPVPPEPQPAPETPEPPPAPPAPALPPEAPREPAAVPEPEGPSGPHKEEAPPPAPAPEPARPTVPERPAAPPRRLLPPLPPKPPAPAQIERPPQERAPEAPEGVALEAPPTWRERIQSIREKTGIGGHARVDYYSASKRLDDNHNLPGLTFQPKAAPKFGSWGDAKIEGRLTDQDVADKREPQQARLLEAYTNFYFKSFDVRIGKQNIPWGRADALNPTDNLTPKDFTLLSARDEEERRTGTVAMKANYYRGPYTLSLMWLPLFNPSIIPLTAPPGLLITEEKRNKGQPADQGFAAKLDHTGGDLDWSLSYYYGLDVLPIGRPVTPTQTVLVHNRIHVIGLDFAKPIGRYGLRGEAAYVQTQNPDGKDFFIKNPYFLAVLGVDRDITDDLNVNIQAYHRYIVSFNDPFAIEDPVARSVAVLSDTFNQQLNRIQGGFTGRLKATWLNKTLEGELLGMVNLPRKDFFLRPSLAYALTDVWKLFVGWDIFNGRRDSFFGRLQPTSAFFVEVRATF